MCWGRSRALRFYTFIVQRRILTITLNSNNVFIVQLSEGNVVVTDGAEAILLDTSTDFRAANTITESMEGADMIGGNKSATSLAFSEPKEESPEPGCTSSELSRDGEGGSSELSDKSGKFNIGYDSRIAEPPIGRLATCGQRSANDDNLVLHSAEVLNQHSF